MVIMYVDDSGAPSYADHTNFFVLSGIIVQDNHVKKLQRSVFEYKQDNFEDHFIDSEIHTHDIYKAKGSFETINLAKKSLLLKNLYNMVNEVDYVGISVVIDKKKLKIQKPTWNVSNIAWSFLIERYDKYLEENSIELGQIKIDKSSNKFHREIIKIIRDLIDNGTSYQREAHIAFPEFVDSSAVSGIQVADALAYCTLAYNMTQIDFNPYWNIVFKKFRKSKFGKVNGYGYKVYPL